MTETRDLAAADEPRTGDTASDPAWSVAHALEVFAMPMPELLLRAQQVHRQHFDPAEVELATLLSIKTGGCPEDCAYCPQSAHHDAGLEATPLLELQSVVDAARRARDAGATRFCMGAAWRAPKPRQIEAVARMIGEVKALGMQACVTLGMLQPGQAEILRDAGLDYYNHNLDTAPEFYGSIISTRCYEDRLRTLERVRTAGLKVCCGGIVGMGESRAQRAGLLVQLANLRPYPESVPINRLVRVAGTPLADQAPLDPLEFVRTVATARILMPRARVRLSAGRESMDDSLQALCLLAGANSIFFGETLLTTANPSAGNDLALLERMGMRAKRSSEETH